MFITLAFLLLHSFMTPDLSHTLHTGKKRLKSRRVMSKAERSFFYTTRLQIVSARKPRNQKGELGGAAAARPVTPGF